MRFLLFMAFWRQSWVKLSLFITLAMLLGLSGLISANAAESNFQFAIPEGVIPATPEEFEAYWNSLNEEEKAFIAEKEAASAQLAEQVKNQPATRAATKISIPGTFTIYQQEETMYCAPACVKSMIQYLNGSSPSQSVIAGEMGTSFLTGTPVINIAPYLNEMVDEVYIRSANPSLDAFKASVYATIVDYKDPAMMAMVNHNSSYWHYNTDGHAVVINAIYSDRNTVQIADPAGSKYNKSFYTKSSSIANTVCTDLIW